MKIFGAQSHLHDSYILGRCLRNYIFMCEDCVKPIKVGVKRIEAFRRNWGDRIINLSEIRKLVHFFIMQPNAVNRQCDIWNYQKQGICLASWHQIAKKYCSHAKNGLKYQLSISLTHLIWWKMLLVHL